jgi:transposase
MRVRVQSTMRARLALTNEQRHELERLGRESDAQRARRAQVILLSLDGISGVVIAQRLRLSPGQVSRIRQRFAREGVAGLDARPRPGRKDHAVPGATVEKLLVLSSSAPPSGHARWSTRLLARAVGLTSATVSKILRAHARPSYVTVAEDLRASAAEH